MTIALHDSTIAYIITEIARQAHLRPVFDNDSPLFTKRVAIRIDNARVLDAFAVALKGTGLVAKLAPDGETVMIRVQSRPSSDGRTQVATGVVVGRVTDSASGMGLGGAQVGIAGIKNLSAITSDSGHFMLRNVPAGEQVLSVKLFGYRPADQTVTVVDSQRTVVRIIMAAVPTVLSGVVTTVTGMQRKVAMGNDITTLNVDSIMRTAPINSVTDLLESRVPGLTVMHSSGEPGAPSRLRLRGIGSISGNNDPVVVVDGVRVYSSQSDTRNDNLAPTASTVQQDNQMSKQTSNVNFAAQSPIDQIDPNSIETIEVFKGPSASALYGSDAANGVIVITTKHGRAGPTQWSLNLGAGINWIPGDWPTNYFRFGHTVGGIGPVCNWNVAGCSIDSIRTFQALNDPQYTLLSHGKDQQASLTVSGGIPVLRYSISGSGSGTTGNLKLPEVQQQLYEAEYGPIPSWMIRPDNLNTWGGSGSLTATPAAKFQITLQSSLFNSNQQQSSLQSALLQLEGVFISNGYLTTSDNTINSLATNPLVHGYVEQVTDEQSTSQNNVAISWQPKVWLPISANGGFQTIQRTDESYIPYGITPAGSTGGCTSDVLNPQCLGDTTGFYGLGRGVSHIQTLNVATAVPMLQQRIALGLGGQYYSSSTNDFAASTSELAPGVSKPTSFLFDGCDPGSDECSAGEDATNSSTYGWFFQPTLNLNSRFFASPGFRLDGGSGGTHASSGGGSTGGLSAFPKLDLSYVAVDRQSRPPLWGFLTLLRPRIAFGLAGTQPDPEDRLRLFNIDAANEQTLGGEGFLSQPAGLCASIIPLNGANVPAVCLNSLGNTQLRPERSSELEGGFDADLLGRFTVTYTRYNKTRKDAIINIPVAPSVSDPGGEQFNIAENIGEVRNTGTEITVDAKIFEYRAFTWNIGANLSNDNNLLVHLNRGQVPNYSLGLVPGYPLFGTWILPIAGFADQDHDGTIEPYEIRVRDSLVYAGQPNPKYQLNFHTDVQLLNGRLGVYANFAYQSGLTQNDQSVLLSNSFFLAGNNPNTPLAYQAAVQAAEGGNGSGFSVIRTPYGIIQTVNTFRFSDLSINYQLPKLVASWFRVPRVMMAVQGRNLALHTNYRGQDPDVNAFSTVSGGDETADLGQIPEPRSWWLKFTLGN